MFPDKVNHGVRKISSKSWKNQLPSRNREGKSPSGEMTTGPSGKAFPSWNNRWTPSKDMYEQEIQNAWHNSLKPKNSKFWFVFAS